MLNNTNEWLTIWEGKKDEKNTPKNEAFLLIAKSRLTTPESNDVLPTCTNQQKVKEHNWPSFEPNTKCNNFSLI